jgi:flagellar biosynthesis protein FlhG
LRKLVLRAMREGSSAKGPAPRLVLITSGREGVGVTSLGVNISIAMSEQGLRIVLVDADSRSGGATSLCGLTGCGASTDLVTARQDIHEVLQRGPAGIQLVPGLRCEGQGVDLRPLSMERFVRQLAKLGRHTDAVIVDVGQGEHYPVQRLSLACDDVIVVTTPDNASVADAYAHIKLKLSGSGAAKLWLIVNRADEPVALDVHQRVQKSCERFLGHSIRLLGWIPDDSVVSLAARRATPFVLLVPASAASQAAQRVAQELAIAGPRYERTKSAAG